LRSVRRVKRFAEATELEETDCEVMSRLIKKAPRSVEGATGDGAYDTANCYAAADEMGINLLTPPRRGAVHWSGNTQWEKRRNETISEIEGLGGSDEARKLWKKLRGYHRRSLVETSYSRFKGTFGTQRIQTAPGNYFGSIPTRLLVDLF